VRITPAGGLNSARRYLSWNPEGTLVDLRSSDVESGRQKWILEASKPPTDAEKAAAEKAAAEKAAAEKTLAEKAAAEKAAAEKAWAAEKKRKKELEKEKSLGMRLW